jgi:hypothetical protein
MARWPTPDNPYADRKKGARWPKAHLATGGKVSSTKHPAGLGDVHDGYLRGHSGGEAAKNYHRTTRKQRTPANYGSKPEK